MTSPSYRIAMGIEYDGSCFQGWQKQNHASSVQETLELALTKMATHPVKSIAAGRTDARVHALNQVIHFDTTVARQERAWVCGSNAVLKADIRVLWAKQVSGEFDARKSALSRSYRYIVYNHPIRPSLFRKQMGWYYRELDIQRMREGAHYWLGEHDFSSFRASQCQSKSPIREVKSLVIQRFHHMIAIDIEANAFLHHMVRNMVGVLWKIGSGKVAPVHAKEVLLARDRRLGGITAPAEGLYLMAVRYPDVYDLPKPLEGPLFLNRSALNEEYS